ncbi:alpha-2-HS-glycoprotein [Paroedura picta]|uniref:alpha-2-HS-glycoprotein n=1 Tax=Paroedura picta TaxID=143630 RepID=UPI0040567726
MKLLVPLLLLAQLLSCKAGLVLPGHEELLPVLPHNIEKYPDCDGPESEAIAAAAVQHINKHLKHGYKFDLNRIEKIVQLERRPHGKLVKLELDLVETKCHIVSPTPVENCTVRTRMEHAVEGDCDVNLIESHGKYKVVHTNCHSEPDSAEDVNKLCPDCALLSLLNDTEVVNTVHTALDEYNALNTTHDHYKLLEISRGQHSHLAKSVYAEFAIVNTNCSAQHAKEHEEDCHVETGEHLHYGFCTASFHKGMTPDSADQHDVLCTIYDHQPGVSHHHLTKEHLEGKLQPAGRGFAHLDLVHSHHNTSGSHSHSHSDEVVAVEQPASLVKRAILPVVQACPGRYRHFDL